ncbi:MAG: PqqD family protein [Polyangiaceae bacterium]|nr:PqqD family protein [Polyangiaceae bacterium]
MSSPEPVLYQPLTEDEAAVLDLEHRALYTLNATAKRIFELARDGATVDTIVEALAREFDAPPAVREDVERFLAEASARGLLDPPPSGG